MGGGGGGSGPTVQQQQMEAMQAKTNANLNLEENAQRKAILNSMLGTRVFRGSALSRAVRGNTPGTGGEEKAPAPSATQVNSAQGISGFLGVSQKSLLDEQRGSGNTVAGGTGASGGATASASGGYRGGGGSRGGLQP